MLMAHKVIDALLGRGTVPLMKVPGLADDEKHKIANEIRQAQKFDFGALVLELIAKERGEWKVPELTNEEKGFWSEGLLPLPFPICWFEFVLSDTRSGILVHEIDEWLMVRRVDLTQEGVLVDGMTCGISRIDNKGLLGCDWEVKVSKINYLTESLKLPHDSPIYQQAQFLLRSAASNAPLAVYMTLMLNSRSTEKKVVVASKALNAARAQRRREPLADHTVVKIVPDGFQYERHPVTGELTQRRSPRLHWRRSHVRTYPDGRRVLIARMLVGLAENGTVSHEYKVIGNNLTSDQ